MRQVFGDEFKREAIRLARTSGLTQERVATDLGIGKSTLAKWIQADAKIAGSGGNGALGDVDLLKENERLRQENRVLREEREILKKATQYFAGLK
jgi:transposase